MKHMGIAALIAFVLSQGFPLASVMATPATTVTQKNLPLLLSGENVARAISYSGYRDGQSPSGKNPSESEVREDLHLVARHFNLIRLYRTGPHTETILKVIEEDKLPIKVMLGAWLSAEVNNPKCPWGKPESQQTLNANKVANAAEIDAAIAMAKAHPQTITAVAVGNEILVEWTDHLVPSAAVLAYVKKVRANVTQLVTVAENYVPWQKGEDTLVEQLDFITLHTYPIWEKKTIDQSLAYTIENYQSVVRRHPKKPVAIGEAGWTTSSDGKDIAREVANEGMQKTYFELFKKWTEDEGIVGFYFQAFDGQWKGGNDPDEPEKHWGLFTSDRKPKLAACELYDGKIVALSMPASDAHGKAGKGPKSSLPSLVCQQKAKTLGK